MTEILLRSEQIQRVTLATRKLREKLEAKAMEGDLISFVQYVWPVVEPAIEFVQGWALSAIADHLQAVTRGEIRRLLINVPPGFSKSLLTDVFWPAWEWGPQSKPWYRYVCASYSNHLTERDNMRCRNVVMSDRYQRLWGSRFRISNEQFTKVKFANDKTGWKLATSTGGIGVGERGDRFIIDDPNNTMLMESEAVRYTTNMWFTEVVPDRLNNPRESAIVVIQQRLHEEDVSGVALDRDLGYTHLCYDDQTEILTRSGWIKFPELTGGIEVMGVDPGTLKARWEMPTRYVKERHSGAMLAYRSATADLVVTPDHRMIYADSNDMLGGIAKRWRVRAAKDLPNDFYLPQVVNWDGLAPDQDIEFAGEKWKAGNLAEFLGWYLSEGCASAKRCWTRITQRRHSLGAREIDRVFSAIPFKKKHRGPNGKLMDCWSIGSKALASALEPLGNSLSKRAPAILDAMGPECLRAFIAAYGLGDGTITGIYKTGISITTASKRMADDLQRLSIQAGWSVTLNTHLQKSYGRSFNGCKLRDLVMYQITVRRSKVVGKSRKIASKIDKSHTKEVPYDGWVYCVSVPSTGVVVRRNGRVTVSGNCIPMEYVPHGFVNGYTVEGKIKTFDTWDPDPEAEKPVKPFWNDPRTEEDEPAWPIRFGPREIEELKNAKGPYAWAGQYQQTPEVRGGSIIRRDYWNQWEEEKYPELEYILASIDTAYTEKQENDASAMTVWGMFRDANNNPKIILLYAWQEKLEIHKLVQRVIDTCTKDNRPIAHARFQVDKLLIEAKASGLSVSQEIRRIIGFNGKFGIELINPTKQGDKVARAHSILHLFSDGMIYTPNKSWADEVINQSAIFPKGSKDDLVDSTTMALRYLRDHGFAMRREEAEFDAEEELKYRSRSAALYPC